MPRPRALCRSLRGKKNRDWLSGPVRNLPGRVHAASTRDLGKTMAKIDIAITCYQYGQFLRHSAGSVLSQDFRDLRLLIIDNASTDGSQQIAQDIAASDNRVELILNSENRGYHD